MKKRLLTLIPVVCMVFSLAACSTSAPVTQKKESAQAPTPAETQEEDAGQEAEAGTSDGNFSLAAVMNASGNPSTNLLVSRAEAKAKEYGWDFQYSYYDSNTQTMIQQLENLINAGVDGILLQVQSATDATDVLNTAVEKGIKIGLFDNELEGVDYDFIYGADNIELGHLLGSIAGKWAQENLADKGIDVIVGIMDYPTIPEMIKRATAIEEGIISECPSAQVVMKTMGGDAVSGVKAGEDWLQAYPNMNLTSSITDGSLVGVCEAFKAAGVTHEVGMFGCDCIDEALKLIAEDGMYKCTIDLDLGGVGEHMVETMKTLVDGGEIEKWNYFSMTPVTIDNVDEYLTE